MEVEVLMKLLQLVVGACMLTALVVAPVAAQQDATMWTKPIAVGDILLLQVWREDIDLNLIVPENGVIHFPRVGAIDVRGLTRDSLRARLVRDYGVHLRDAESRIQLAVQRKVRITGAVREPNVYTLNPTMTLADAIATAGGALPEGRRDRVELRRDGQVVQVLLLDDAATLADSPIQSGDQLHVPERSFASRNLNVLVTALTSIVAIGIAIASAK
jgi:polysaccharide export outer membrane protein